MTAAVHYLVEEHRRFYSERGFLCEPNCQQIVRGDHDHQLAGPTTRDPSAVTCPECLYRLADRTAERLRAEGKPDWLRRAEEHDLRRMLGETDEGFRDRLAGIMRRTP